MPLNLAELKVLKDEVAQDSGGLGYAGKTDKEVADILNLNRQVGSTTNRALTAKEIIDATTSQKIAQIQEASDSPSGVQAAQGRVDAIRFDYYMTAVGAIDVAPGTQGRATLDALVTAGILTAGDIAGFVTLSEQKVFTKRRKQMFSGINDDITAADVAAAKAV